MVPAHPQVAQNEAVGKKAKSLFFVSSILSSIAQFLTLGDGHLNVDDVETEQDLNEMDLPLCSYHLLIVLCTNFRMGICYKPKWDQTALMKCVLDTELFGSHSCVLFNTVKSSSEPTTLTSWGLCCPLPTIWNRS